MLAFTPAIDEVLDWFALTHERRATGFGAEWVRVALPKAGGLADQDAWLIQALRYTRRVHNELIAEEQRRRDRERDVEAWRSERRREAGQRR